MRKATLRFSLHHLRRYAYAIVASLALTSTACGPGPTPRDLELLAQLETQYKDEFDLHPARDTYLRVEYRLASCPGRELAEQLLRAFWLDARGEKRRDSMFTYLNVETSRGKFCYQLYWSRELGRIEYSSQAYY